MIRQWKDNKRDRDLKITVNFGSDLIFIISNINS